MQITFLAATGCLSSGIAGLLDMFAIANIWQSSLTGNPEPLFVTEITTFDGKPVLGSSGIQLNPHRPLAMVTATDLVLIPPFIPLPDPAMANSTELADWLCARHHAGIPIAAMCTGAFLLAQTGLLNGKSATTNWQFAGKFRRLFPAVHLHIEQTLTEEDGLICTGAATSYLNLGLRIISRHGSPELASTCAKALLIDPNRDSQTPYFIFRQGQDHNDLQVNKAQHYLAENLAKPIRIDDVANHVHISPRHFKRRFKQATGYPPVHYLQLIRIEAAKKKLETTFATIEEITRQIGYEDSSTFRRLFKYHTKLSPREYRDKFFCM